MKKIICALAVSSLFGTLNTLASAATNSVSNSATNTALNSASNSASVLSDAEIQAAIKLRDSSRLNNIGLTILESLTTEVGARPAGSAGDARAVAWAEAKFKALGFDKVWREPVTFPVWTRGIESAEIVAPFPQKLYVTALGNSVSTEAEGLQAELIEFASLDALKAASADTVKGKIVFINHKMKVSRDYGSVVSARSRGASFAAERGAVGIVIRSVGTDSHRFPHTGMMRYQEGIAKIPAAAMSNSDADLVANMLRRGQPVRLKLNLSNSTQASYTSYNVIGEMTGSQLPDEYVLIGGHHDSWDLATGALDDGAGCAITMAAAVAIKQAGLKPKRSIRVVLFANEEMGLFGGKAYLAAHQHEIHKIQAGSEADAGQGPVIRLSSYVRPEALPVVKQIQQTLASIGVVAGDNQADSGPDISGLSDAGMATFDLSLKADDYFDYHHTPDDTFDKIEPARFNQSVAAYATFTYMAAQSPVHFGSGSGLAKKK